MVPTDLNDYLNMNYTVVLRRGEEGDWVATIKEFEGCMADGPTPDQAIQDLESMKELWLKARVRSRRPIPLPERVHESFSGKFLQRVPKSLHRKLATAAERDGVSLNQFTTAILAEAVGEKAAQSKKGCSVSVFAFGGIDRWSADSESAHAKWQTTGHRRLDRKRRDHSLRTLLKSSTQTESANQIGREPKSGDEEETHEIWNA